MCKFDLPIGIHKFKDVVAEKAATLTVFSSDDSLDKDWKFGD